MQWHAMARLGLACDHTSRRLRPNQACFASILFLAIGVLPHSIVTAADKSGVSPNTISLPKGPGSIEGLGEAFQPTLNTGTAKYAVPLQLPPGTAGHAPDLKLIYEGGSGNGPLGYGWQLPSAFIQRQTDKGVPTYGTNMGFERLDRFINEAKEELVPRDDGFLFCENEGAFIRYRHIGLHWEATLPDGTRLEFGASSAARIEDSATGRVFRWLLEREVDTHGNTIVYSYTNFPGPQNLNAKYLSQIRYGPGGPPWDNSHFVTCSYEDRPDWFEDCRAGFLVRSGKRLKSITVGTQGPTLAGHLAGDFSKDGAEDFLVRRYDLEYSAYAGTNSHWSLLAKVTLVGADGVASLPPSTFGYNVCNPSNVLSATGEILGGQNEAETVMDNELVDLVDLNGDGLPDILKTGGPHHEARLNLGESTVGGEGVIRWSNPVEVASESGDAWNFDLSATSTHLADMDGDGAADLVHKSTDTVLFFRNRSETRWSERQPMSTGVDPPPAPFGVANVRTADIDFDKRIDLIRGDGLEYQIWFNLGSNQYSGRITIPQENAFDLGLTAVQVADMNGDRIPDLGRIEATRVQVTAGLGYGQFAVAKAIMLTDLTLDDGQISKAKLSDITGDGIADLVIERAFPGELWYWINLGNYTFSSRKVITEMPVGVSPTAAIRWADVDGNGSTDLLYADSQSAPRIQSVDVGELLNCGLAPNVLTAISNGIGRITLIGYEPSTSFRLKDAAMGRPWPDAMPFPVTVVASVTNLDSLGHEYITRFRYHDGYYDPLEKQFRGFGQVEQIDLGDVSAPTLVTRSHFDTGRDFEALKGKLIRLTTETETGGVFEDEFTVWTVPPRVLMTGTNGQPVHYAHPSGARNLIKELGRGTERRVESEMAFDEFGNQTLDADYGIVEGNDRSAFDDERFTITEFAINTNEWLLRFPKRQEIRDDNSNVVSRTDSFYDDETFSGLNSGEVRLGNLTMKREWVAPSNSTRVIRTSRSKYDAYGNPTIILDPLAAAPSGAINVSQGHLREIVYDSRFHTFPTRETIHVGNGSMPLVFEATYNEAFGTLLTATDYNDQMTRFGYDLFARLISIVKPRDTTAYPTIEYSYHLATPFSLSESSLGLVNFIETRLLDQSAGTAGTKREHYFISRQFTDGLGRALMTKTEAEPLTNAVSARVAVKGAVQFNNRQKPARLLNPYFSAMTGDLDSQLAFEHIEAPGWNGVFHEEGTLVSLALSNAHAVATTYDATLREIGVSNPDFSQRATGFEPLVTKLYDEADTSMNSPHRDTPFVHHSDGLGRLIRVDEVVRINDDGTSGPLAMWTTRYKYDLNDQLIQIVDSQQNVKLFSYDALKRKTFMNDPNRGIMQFEYDDASNLLETTDAKGQRITYTYDGANRILTEDYRDEGRPFSRGHVFNPALAISATNRPDVAYFYDTPIPSLPQGDGSRATARYTIGRLAYVWDLAGEEHTSYDERGREEWVVKAVRDPLHGKLVSFRTAFAYDSLDRLTAITYPDNDAVTYHYNRWNLPVRISGSVAGPILASCNYVPNEQPHETLYGDTNATICAYDSRMRLKRLITRSAAFATDPLVHFSYLFDPVSNLERIVDERPPSVIPVGDVRRNSQSYQYDSLYRLTGASFSRNLGEPDGLGGSIAYRYDRLGNLLSQISDIQHFERSGTNMVPIANLGEVTTGGAGGRFGRVGRGPNDPPGPHAMTGITEGESLREFNYDANGNVSQIDGMVCVWDFRDRLISVEDATMRAEYSYDYSDRRITKRVVPKDLPNVGPQSPQSAGPATVLYVGKHFEVRENEAPVKYVWNGSTRVARVTRTLSVETNRAQRFRLARGWNLISVALDGATIPIEGFRAAYKWNQNTQVFEPVEPAQPLEQGAVLWLNAESDTTLVLRGTYQESLGSVGSETGFLPLLRLEPLDLILGIPPPTSIRRYDAVGQRWQTHLPAPLTPLSDLPAFIPSGEAIFVHSSDAVLLATNRSSLSVRFYHQDHLGSASVICDAAGAVVEEVANYPFGAPRHQWSRNRSSDPYGFTQKERDAESRLHYVEARFLSAGSARFLSCDKVQIAPALLETPQVLHAYSYSANRPLSHRDPDGNFISALITAGFAAYDTYQYAVGNIGGAEYAGRMALNGAALVADVASGGLGGGMAVRATALAARGGKVGMAVLKGAVAVDKANNLVETAQAAISLKDAVKDGDLTRAGLSVVQIAVGAKGAKNKPAFINHAGKSTAAAKRASGFTVLGHHPEYSKMADTLGHRRFEVPEAVWNRMTDAQKWAANQKFLDRTISRGDAIVLSTPLDKVRPGSYFARELEYLSSKGYVPSADGTRLVPGGGK